MKLLVSVAVMAGGAVELNVDEATGNVAFSVHGLKMLPLITVAGPVQNPQMQQDFGNMACAEILRVALDEQVKLLTGAFDRASVQAEPPGGAQA